MNDRLLLVSNMRDQPPHQRCERRRSQVADEGGQ